MPKTQLTRNIRQTVAPKIRRNKKLPAKNSSRSLRTQRRWHIRWSLHPLNIMTVLCAGVLLIAATISSYGDSYTVSASVPAALLTAPAIILEPSNNQHGETQTIDVAGSCPTSSYVKVTVNSTFAGVSSCANNSFQVSVSLQPGENQLSAQDYNQTDEAGPTSATVAFFYDAPSTSQPSPSTSSPNTIAPPIILEVTQIDSGVTYKPSTTQIITSLPTFQGVAPPYSRISIVTNSPSDNCITTANTSGFWKCTFTTTLSPGEHTVNISATTTNSLKLSFPAFYIKVSSSAVSHQSPPTQPPSLSSNYYYQTYPLHQQLTTDYNLEGGLAPYALTIKWGDGTTTTFIESTAGNVSFKHTYSTLHASYGAFTVQAQVIDAEGRTASLQLIAYVRNPAFSVSAAGTTSTHLSIWRSFLQDVHPWLWILWPGYAVIILMLISFWLGERRQLQADQAKQKSKRVTRKRTKNHA